MTIFLYANNAKSALAGAITNTATTANLTSGSGVLFPNPAAGQQFALTFVDAATGLLNEIVYVTARSGDTITIVRAQEGTTALNWSAGDIAASLVTAGNMTNAIQPGQTTYSRIRLSANTTFHFSNSGSDSTGNGTSGSPWATLNFALSYVQQNYDLNNFNVTFLSDTVNGTYSGGTIVPGIFVGQQAISNVLIDCNGSTVSGSSSSVAFAVNCGAQCAVRRTTFTNTNIGQGVVQVSPLSRCDFLDGIVFGAGNSSTAHLAVAYNGVAQLLNSYSITGGGGWHYFTDHGCIAIPNVVTVTVTGTPTFTSQFVQATHAGSVSVASGVTYTGAATGSRYEALMNGTIDTVSSANPTFFPGSSPGTTVLGGQYN